MARGRLFHAISTAILLTALQCADSYGQPMLNFKRLVNNWPTIELYFAAGCNGQPAYFYDKQNLRVFENGFEITDFELWCPDTTVKCEISLALVFDVSGSMMGAGIAGEKDAGNAFVDEMDGSLDEAAVIVFNSAVATLQGMTTDRSLLHNAINSMTAGGATAVWDGIFAGVQQVVADGVNPCRAVIALTDGEDNSSTKSPPDIIALAVLNHIRVFTVGLGGSINSTDLESIATQTGGRYYQTPNPSQLAQIYREIAGIVKAGWYDDCYIRYQAACEDGGLRTVDLSVVNFCGGNDTKVKTYRAPRDTGTFVPLHISLGSVAGSGNSLVTVPLVLADTLQNAIFPTAFFTVMFDSQCSQFVDIQTPPGTLLQGARFLATQLGGGYMFEIRDAKLVSGTGTLAELTFLTGTRSVPDTLFCDLDLRDWTFNSGCFQPVLGDGRIGITGSIKPVVRVHGALPACSGDTVLLSTSGNLPDVLWSTGDTAQFIAVHQPGQYWYSTIIQAVMLYSDTVTVSFLPPPGPELSFTGDTTICSDQDFRLRELSSHPGRVWSTGDSTREIRITQTGAYSVTVIDTNGCKGTSDSVHVTVIPNAPPVLLGLPTVCEFLTTNYSTQPRAGMNYQWTVTGGALTAGQGTETITVTWGGVGAGNVGLVATHVATGCTAAASKDVTIAQLQKPVVQPSGTIVLCPGDSVTLDAGDGYQSYVWSTGGIERFLTVRTQGSYTVRVSNGPGCEIGSDTVEVIVQNVTKPAVTGSRVVCMNSDVTYSTSQQAGHSYDWTAVGGSILSGNGTPSVSVKWGIGPSGKLICRAFVGQCVDSVTLDIAIGSFVVPTIAVSGPRRFCEGGSVTLDAGDGYVSYQWSNGLRTRTINVNQSGSYSVYVETANGCTGSSAPVTIEVLPKPPVPVITQNGNILTTGLAPSYQWLMDGAELQGEINQFLLLRGSGRYQVTITDTNGCQSTSAPFDIITGIAHPSTPAQRLDVYPDPSNGNIEVNAAFAQPSPATYTVYTMYGSVIRTISRQSAGSADRFTLDLAGIPPGVYMIAMTTRSGVLHRKFVVM